MNGYIEHTWINGNTIRFILSLVVTAVMCYQIITGHDVPEWFIGISITIYAFYFGTPVVKATLSKLKEDN